MENRKVAKRVAMRECYLAATMESAKGPSLVAAMGPRTMTVAIIKFDCVNNQANKAVRN